MNFPDPQTDLAVHAIINGPLGMSPGKIAAQTFQACQRLYAASRNNELLAARLQQWEQCGTKTVIHRAQTERAFQRLCEEAPYGVLMIDEGINEIAPNSPTIWASWPCSRQEQPRILANKQIKLWLPKTAEHHPATGELVRV